MRLRIRGPSGQSTVNLDDGATIETLKQSIATETGLSSFDIKYGYPPKPFNLAQYSSDQLLSNLDVKLNGEQLLVVRSESKVQESIPAQSSSQSSLQPGPSKAPISKTQKPRTSTTEPSQPLSLTRKQRPDNMDSPEISMPNLGGKLVLRIMPDDNSCLFRAISSAVMSDFDAVTELRSIVAETIQGDTEQFNKAVLDNKEPDDYCKWIKSQDSWGGQVELWILSQHFQVEIFSIDVQTLRVDKYNEGAARRCFVVYSGIHYDTIALNVGVRPEDDVKQFEAPFKDEVLPAAEELCRQLQSMHYFTDTAGFSLKCNDCGAILTGEKGATEHASKTGHYNFGEAG